MKYRLMRREMRERRHVGATAPPSASRGCFQTKAAELGPSLANVGVRRLHAVLFLLSSAICGSRQHPSILLRARLPTSTRPRTLCAREEFSCARSRVK